VHNSNSDAEDTLQSIIDFHSTGFLTLKDSCFKDNIQLSTHGFSTYVIAQEGATIINSNNYIQSKDVDRACSFISIVSQGITAPEFVECGGSAIAPTCAQEPPQDDIDATSLVVCFSSENQVQLADGEAQYLDQLKLGDKVLTRNGYEPIYSWGHYDPSKSVEFVQLLPSRIELSSNHLLFLEDNRAVPAGTIKVGDTLLSGDVVKAVRRVKRQGAYAPFTHSGTIIVNSQVASSFVSLQETSEVLVVNGWSTNISHHWIAHMFESPHRFWCTMKGGCTRESYTTDGISTWVYIPLKFFSWLLDLRFTL